MKKLYLQSVLCLLNLSALAAPILEPFDDQTANGGTSYAIGTVLATNALNGVSIWNSIGANNNNLTQPTNVAGNHSYTNLPPSTGHSVNFVPVVGQGARLGIAGPITSANKAYYSFILKITDISSVPTTPNNNYFAGFSDGIVSQPNNLARCGTRLLTKKISSTTFVLGTSKTGVTTDMLYEPDANAHPINVPLFIVGSFEVAGSVTNCNLWVNPPIESFGSNLPPAFSVTASGGTGNTALNNSGVAAFVINCQSTAAPAGIIDELRVSTNWTYVTGGDPAILSVPANKVVGQRARPAGGDTKRGGTQRGNNLVSRDAEDSRITTCHVRPIGAHAQFVYNSRWSRGTLAIDDECCHAAIVKSGVAGASGCCNRECRWQIRAKAFNRSE